MRGSTRGLVKDFVVDGRCHLESVGGSDLFAVEPEGDSGGRIEVGDVGTFHFCVVIQLMLNSYFQAPIEYAVEIDKWRNCDGQEKKKFRQLASGYDEGLTMSMRVLPSKAG